MEKNSIVQELIDCRKQHGLSQRALAERMNVGQYVVARIESGKASPTLRTLMRMTDALGVELRLEDEAMGKHFTAGELPKELQPYIAHLDAAKDSKQREDRQMRLAMAIADYVQDTHISEDCFSLIRAQYLNPDFLPKAQAKKRINVFHGSSVVVERPQMNRCRSTNDFGKCFYTTEYLDLAKEWAAQNMEGGKVSAYELRLDGLNVLNLNNGEYSILNWIGTILQYRVPRDLDDLQESARKYLVENFAVNLSEADVIQGYRADDSYFQYTRDFLSNTIGIDTLTEAMRLGNLGEQIAIHSKKAFNRLMFRRSYPITKDFYAKYQKRDHEARKGYADLRPKSYQEMVGKDSMTIAAIMQEGMTNHDARIPKIVFSRRPQESR